MIGWMLFAAAVAALAGAAALAAERALRLLRLPTRGAWAAALAAALALPFVLPRPAVDDADSTVGAIQPSQATQVMPAGGADATATLVSVRTSDRPTVIARVEAALPWGWGASTLAVAAVLAVAALRLAWRRREWPVKTVAGERVLVSPEVGPAVVGFVRPRIVLPRWALNWAEPLQRLMLRHEREHVRAGDPLLLLAGLAAVALMPWNPALWWQLRRMRLAMEVDCDARTLRDSGDVLAYGRLLLEIGRLGGAGAPVPLVAFSEPRSFLERRIDAMTLRMPPHRPRLVLAWTAVASVTAVSLAALPAPARVPLLPARTAAPAAPLLPSVTQRASAPAFTSAPVTLAPMALAPVVATAAAPGATLAATASAQPVPALQPDTAPVWELNQVDRAPEITNRQAMQRALERAYPPLLRDAGIEGMAVVQVVVGADGAPQNPTVLYSDSSHEAFRPAAIEVVKVARFSPAVKNGQPVRVKVVLPVAFHAPRGSAEVPRIGNMGYDDAVAMRNREAMVRQLLAAHYPRVAETGTAEREYVWFVVDGRSDNGRNRVRQSGTGTIEMPWGWTSNELLRQMRQRIPGFAPDAYFFGEYTTAENGPRVNVAWFLDYVP
ncbi:MAG TPA: M56 family metallopeptidase [Longimicrobium sp.]|nr:M56 family metallopeptidase [Longimicrobium sp.]